MATRMDLSPDQLNRPARYSYRRSIVANWCELIPGDTVLLFGPGTEQQYTGTVDAISEDGTIVWLILENGGGRRLFYNTDGCQTLLNP
jgi:hypothetical protein